MITEKEMFKLGFLCSLADRGLTPDMVKQAMTKQAVIGATGAAATSAASTLKAWLLGDWIQNLIGTAAHTMVGGGEVLLEAGRTFMPYVLAAGVGAPALAGGLTGWMHGRMEDITPADVEEMKANQLLAALKLEQRKLKFQRSRKKALK